MLFHVCIVKLPISVHFGIAIVSLIFQPNAHTQFNICIDLLNVSHMFRHSLCRSQGELFTTSQKPLIVRLL